MAPKTALQASRQLRNCRKCGQPFLPTHNEVVCHSPCLDVTPRAKKLRKLLTHINHTPIHHNVFTNLLSLRLCLTEETLETAETFTSPTSLNSFALPPFPDLATERDAILKLLSITEYRYKQIYPHLKPYITCLLKQSLAKELRPWKAPATLRTKKTQTSPKKY